MVAYVGEICDEVDHPSRDRSERAGVQSRFEFISRINSTVMTSGGVHVGSGQA